MKTSDFLIYEAIFPQARLLHLGQTGISLSTPLVDTTGIIKLALQFLQWYIFLIGFYLLLCYLIYSYNIYNNIAIFIIVGIFLSTNNVELFFGGFY